MMQELADTLHNPLHHISTTVMITLMIKIVLSIKNQTDFLLTSAPKTCILIEN